MKAENTLGNKIVITGAAGLLGHNLILLLGEMGYKNIIAIDKNENNMNSLCSIAPWITPVVADLSSEGNWSDHFSLVDTLVIAHARITGNNAQDFIDDNITATGNVIAVAESNAVPHTIHISSSVVNSKACDDYTETKKQQEALVKSSQLKSCILRPTLMFGWFDPKHLGWLSRLMSKVPVFPIPGNGKYLRQPLYCRDFCRVIQKCIERRETEVCYDIIGHDEIFYVDIIKQIKAAKGLKTFVLPVPYHAFKLMLHIAGFVMKKPPFTVSQLEALVVGDYFRGVDMKKTFDITPTPVLDALRETFSDNHYAGVQLERTSK